MSVRQQKSLGNLGSREQAVQANVREVISISAVTSAAVSANFSTVKPRDVIIQNTGNGIVYFDFGEGSVDDATSSSLQIAGGATLILEDVTFDYFSALAATTAGTVKIIGIGF